MSRIIISIIAFMLLAFSGSAWSVVVESSDGLNEKVSQVQGTVQKLDDELNRRLRKLSRDLADERAEVADLQQKLRAARKENQNLNRELSAELKVLRRQNQFIIDTLTAPKSPADNDAQYHVFKAPDYERHTPDGKMIFGASEFVFIREVNATIAARIDSGAAYSSISAQDVERFERDGTKMVRFVLPTNDQIILVEAPFVKNIRVRQALSDEAEGRPVIRLNLKVGEFSGDCEFTITDRSHMNYPLLLGRNLLTDIAVVDVAREYIQPRTDKDGLLLLSDREYREAAAKGTTPAAQYESTQAPGAGEQPAYPAADYGNNLGTESNKALVERKNLEPVESADTPRPREESEKKESKEGEKDKELSTPAADSLEPLLELPDS